MNGSDIDVRSAPRVAPEATLDALADIACETDGPIVVGDGTAAIGYVSKRRLLKGIQGRP